MEQQKSIRDPAIQTPRLILLIAYSIYHLEAEAATFEVKRKAKDGVYLFHFVFSISRDRESVKKRNIIEEKSNSNSGTPIFKNRLSD